ncbi:metallophosphoesterase family protein [Adhaeribacter rhizoryzae]|uniref:Phosphoesterase n=1 Tax=Adhaeribacter rhizoryzae TaxID=2607907 RepID=A0A5M6DBD8_9BACT|nr:metallophosphoesterase [Adhaeribacter rhizoryzae]KAA5544878.1 phosphoesterase [Adhaeribacter rhizoryzae]
MKSLLTVPANYFPQYDELYVISDLHLGGTQGFQIFDAGAELQRLIEYLSAKDAAKNIALLINGDLVDFLAEKPALPFDPLGAIDKLNRIAHDPAFTMVWQALQQFVATLNRTLIINLGNHDLELALPWVKAHLLQMLAPDNDAAKGRITLAFEGTGYNCRVGNAQVLCVHGNEVDEWNIADYETIRQLGRDIMQGRPVENWIPNAGTQLVIQIMNGLKVQYPFIDLLKPEAQAVLPTLLALAPEQQDKLFAITATARRLLWDKLRITTGFLGREVTNQEINITEPVSLPTYSSGFYYQAAGSMATKNNQQYAAELLAETEKRLQANVRPVTLVDQDRRAQNLGLPTALFKFIWGEDKSEVLREALEQLQEDRSFDLDQEDETFERLNTLVGDQVDYIIAGHTHLERVLPRRQKKGQYFNSGTWAKLIKLEKKLLQDQAKFREVFNAFKAGSMQALEPYVVRRFPVVAIIADGPITTGKLRYLNPKPGEPILVDSPQTK